LAFPAAEEPVPQPHSSRPHARREPSRARLEKEIPSLRDKDGKPA
jgi:hypothetical protein